MKAIYTKKIKPCLKLFFLFFMIVLANFLFENSLTACNYDVIVCIKWLRSKMIFIVLQVFVFALIHFMMVIVSLFEESKYIKWTGLSLSIVSYGYRIQTSKGFGNVDHSQANMMISEVLIIFMAITWSWWYVTFKLWFNSSIKKPKGYKQASKKEEEEDSVQNKGKEAW